MNPEPIILVFEGMNNKALDQISLELKQIFKGTRFEGHILVVNRMVYGIENANLHKLDEIANLLKELTEAVKNG